MYNNKRKFDAPVAGYFPGVVPQRFPASAYAPPLRANPGEYFGGGGGLVGGYYAVPRDSFPRGAYPVRNISAGRPVYPARSEAFIASASKVYSNRTSTLLDEKNAEVSAAIELFKGALAEAQTQVGAPATTETTEGSEATSGLAAPAEPAAHATLDINALTNLYREKTDNMFKKVFNRTLREFFHQFPSIFTVEGLNVRMTSEAEVEAIKTREAEIVAKREAAEAERKKKAEDKQREIFERIVKDRKAVRERAINVIVASSSALKLEAVRRAITTVLTSTRARAYSRIVVCGSQDCPSEVNEQPFDQAEIIQGAYNRLSHAVKQRILLPPMPKTHPRGGDDMFDNEALYQIISADQLHETLKSEAAARRAVEPKEVKEGETKTGESDDAMKDADAEDKEDLLPGEERELLVADYYVAIESGIVPVKFPNLALDLPSFPTKAPAAEKTEGNEGEEQPLKQQKTDTAKMGQLEQCKFFMNGSCKFGAACRLAHPEPNFEGLPDFDTEDKQTSGTMYVDVAWVVIYNSHTGLSVRIPSTGNNIPSKFVEAARESGFTKTCGSLISEQLSAELDMKINATDPHKMLNAGVISRGHLLEQALTVGFAELTHKEMARKRIAAVARAKEQAAQRVAAKEEHDKEQARKKEEAEEKARREAEKVANDEKVPGDVSDANDPAIIHTSSQSVSQSDPDSVI